jgi:Fe-S cluster biogenesis protein NfuA/nitrite reductase/ring-hydroxylating ferredoxin subunit
MLQTDANSAAQKIDSMLAEFTDDPLLRERAEDLVRALVEFYDIGLGRLVDTIADRPDGEEIMKQVAADKVVAGLLVLHDLHPESTLERVAAALERVRPYLGSHAGDVDLLGVGDDGVVRLRLAGSCNGCPSSSVTVKLAIEQAIEEAAPEIIRIDVEGVAAAPAPRGVGGPGGRTMLPMLNSPMAVPPPAPGGAWVSLDTASDIKPGSLVGTDISGAVTVVANVDGVLYAYRDRCPSCSASLRTGALDGAVLRCAGCEQQFDLSRAGISVTRASLHLEPLPLLTEDGGVHVAVPAGAAR